MAKTDTPTPNPGEQSIEELQRRYQALNTRKIQAETQRDTAKQRLDDLKADARIKYGTDDVAQLKAKLGEMIAENTRKRTVYQADLDKIELGLAEVERKFAEAAPAPGPGGPPKR